MADLAAFLTARYAEAEAAARDLLRTAQGVRLALQEPRLLGRVIPGWHSWADVEAMCNSRLTDIALKRAILAEYVSFREESAKGDVGPGLHMGTQVLGDVARLLGIEFTDHPDYKADE